MSVGVSSDLASTCETDVSLQRGHGGVITIPRAQPRDASVHQFLAAHHDTRTALPPRPARTTKTPPWPRLIPCGAGFGRCESCSTTTGYVAEATGSEHLHCQRRVLRTPPLAAVVH